VSARLQTPGSQSIWLLPRSLCGGARAPCAMFTSALVAVAHCLSAVLRLLAALASSARSWVGALPHWSTVLCRRKPGAGATGLVARNLNSPCRSTGFRRRLPVFAARRPACGPRKVGQDARSVRHARSSDACGTELVFDALQGPRGVAGPHRKPPAQAGGSSGRSPGSRPGLPRSVLTPTEEICDCRAE